MRRVDCERESDFVRRSVRICQCFLIFDGRVANLSPHLDSSHGSIQTLFT
jgi:hypothetical protein